MRCPHRARRGGCCPRATTAGPRPPGRPRPCPHTWAPEVRWDRTPTPSPATAQPIWVSRFRSAERGPHGAWHTLMICSRYQGRSPQARLLQLGSPAPGKNFTWGGAPILFNIAKPDRAQCSFEDSWDPAQPHGSHDELMFTDCSCATGSGPDQSQVGHIGAGAVILLTEPSHAPALLPTSHSAPASRITCRQAPFTRLTAPLRQKVRLAKGWWLRRRGAAGADVPAATIPHSCCRPASSGQLVCSASLLRQKPPRLQPRSIPARLLNTRCGTCWQQGACGRWLHGGYCRPGMQQCSLVYL